MEKVATEERRAPSPQSVTRVIRILEVLCASADPLSLADLSRRLGTPKSSLAALLRGLADEDFVVTADGAWRLGPGAFGLGSALTEARRRFQSSDLIRDGMRRLSARSGETVLLGISGDDGFLTYVDVVESRNSVRFSVAIGDRRPLYATAGGRALLAACSPEAVSSYLKRSGIEKFTATSLADIPSLTAAVDKARECGYAQTVEQASEGVTGTATVIRDATQSVVGALVIAAPSSRSADRLEEFVKLTLDEAAAISRSLGFR